MFGNVPHFRALRDDDTVDDGDTKSKVNKLTMKTLDKKIEKLDEKQKKRKTREKSGNKAPSIKAIREHLKKIIKYHENQVKEEIPSIYPILGPANEDDDNEDDNDWEDQKRKHFKEEMKFGSFRK